MDDDAQSKASLLADDTMSFQVLVCQRLRQATPHFKIQLCEDDGYTTSDNNNNEDEEDDDDDDYSDG